MFEPGDASSPLGRTHWPSGKSHLHANRPGRERKQTRVKRLGPESSQSSSVITTVTEGWSLKKGAIEGPTDFTELRRTAEITETTATAVACYLPGYTHVPKNLLDSHQFFWEDTGHLSAFFSLEFPILGYNLQAWCTKSTYILFISKSGNTKTDKSIKT